MHSDPAPGLIHNAGEKRTKTLTAVGELIKHMGEGKWTELTPEARTLMERLLNAYDYLAAREDRREYREMNLPIKISPAVQLFLFRNGPDGLEIFLGKRSRGGFLNQWCVPGGRRESGESPGEAAVRELEEETKTEIDEQSLIRLIDHVSHTIREKNGERFVVEHHITAYAVLAQDLNPVNSEDGEHSEMEWMPVTKALSMHDQAVAKAADGIDEDTIEDALPSGVRGILMLLGDKGSAEETLAAIGKKAQ